MRLADVRPVADLAPHEEYIEPNITDLEAFTAACEGIDTVLHLAADPSPQADFYQSLLSLNIIGGYNGFEAARRAGSQRIVFANSINAVLGYRGAEAVSWDVPVFPQNVYADQHGLSCISPRDTAQLFARCSAAIAVTASPTFHTIK